MKIQMSNISEHLVRLDVGNKKFRMHSWTNDIFSYIFTYINIHDKPVDVVMEVPLSRLRHLIVPGRHLIFYVLLFSYSRAVFTLYRGNVPV